MNLPKEDLDKAVLNSRKIRNANKSIEGWQKRIDDSLKEKEEHTENLLKCNAEIKKLQGEIRRLGVLCQGINKRVGGYQAKVQKLKLSIKDEEKRLEQKLEDKWVEKKRQEFRRNCYVKNLNI